MTSALNERPLVSINCDNHNIPPSLAFDCASVSVSLAATQPLQYLDNLGASSDWLEWLIGWVALDGFFE